MPAPKEVLFSLIQNISRIVQGWEEKRIAAETKYEKEDKKEKGFFSSGRNETKLKQLSSKTGAVSREQSKLKELNDALSTLTTTLDSDNKIAISQIREIMLIHYIDEYAYGRSRKDGSPLLKAIEDIILNATNDPRDNFLLKNEHLALKKGSGHEHFDSRFLVCQYALIDLELPKVVAHIFDLVLQNTVADSEKNLEVYTAAMKALVRVGLNVAPSEWNALVSKHLGNSNDNPFQISLESVLSAKEKFNEKGIRDNYPFVRAASLTRSNPEVSEKLLAYLGPQRLKTASTAEASSRSSSPTQSSPAESPKAAPTVAPAMEAPPLLSTINRPK
jgi:hypothetical protein